MRIPLRMIGCGDEIIINCSSITTGQNIPMPSVFCSCGVIQLVSPLAFLLSPQYCKLCGEVLPNVQ